MRRIRAVSFNILHGQRGDRSGVVDVDLLGLSAAGLQADLLALQEVDVGVPRSGGADQARAVAEATGMSVTFGKAHRVRGVGKYGNALLARGEIAEVEVLPLSKSARRHEPRSAILATVQLDGGSPALSVAATHLSIHRPEVHDQLEAVVAALAERPLPRVLIGDLNLLPEEVAPVVESAGMALAGGGPTFPVEDPRIRIDHVAGAGVEIHDVDIRRTASSDHCALVVELAL